MRERSDNKGAGRQRGQSTGSPAAPKRPLTGIPGEWVILSDLAINADNIAFVEDTVGGTFIKVHMIRDRADRQKLPVVNEQPWRRKTRTLYLRGDDAETFRKWVRSRGVLIVLPKPKDPDEF